MHDYKSMDVFATVVEQGSMQAAAEKLFMTPSAVTQSIKKLEQQLDMVLLNRTTRKLSLTEAGETFYQHIAEMRKNADKAIHSLDQLRTDPSGYLTIACVTGLVDSQLTQAFQTVLEKHPEFKLNILFEDRVIDLLEQRVDIAIRAGDNTLSDNMIARPLHTYQWKIVVHPDYLATKGIPESLEELAKLDWISFYNQRFNILNFHRKDEEYSLPIHYRINCNTLYASRQLTLKGLGVSIQPDADVKTALESGELVELFSDWQLPPIPLYLVTLQRAQSEKVRIACELISQYFDSLK